MLEIPVNTCNVTYKPIKKRRLKRKKHPSSEEVKNELLKKVNAAAEREIAPNAVGADSANGYENSAPSAAYPADSSESSATSAASSASSAFAGAENGFASGRATESGAEYAYSSELYGSDTLDNGSFADSREGYYNVDNAASGTRAGRALSEKRASASVKREKKPKKKFRISAIGVELAVIGALVAVIFLTSAFYPQSGVNAFIKSVFGTKEVTETIDERTYDEFAPVITTAAGETLSVEDGAVVIGGKGSVYSPLGGVVKSVTADGNGRFNIEIAHSGKFSTIISGIDYAYAAVGDKVFGNIPVGYVKESGVKMCFTGENGAAITDYELSGNAVVWAV